MTHSTSTAAQIGPVSIRERRQALEILFRNRSATDRAAQVATLLDSASKTPDNLGNLLAARRRGRLVGAVLALHQPGKTALVWPPSLADGEPQETAAALMAALVAEVRNSPTRLCQALLELDARLDAERLESAGFFHAADLLYLVCPRVAFPSSPPDGPSEIETFSQSNRVRFERVVEATYRQTLDCPQLNGIRRTSDVLEGYRATGVYDPERWLLFSQQGRDLGCLIQADFPVEDQWELVYMGVAPEFRGNRIGREIVRHAQWRVAQSGRNRLVLAVDADNVPAIRVYQEAGFQRWDRRSVYLHVVSRQLTAIQPAATDPRAASQ